jgi:anaerobic magnesium-protoporphyrin IX monomethyl ester cyclase
MNNQPIILVNPGGRPETDALERKRDSDIYIYPYSLLFLQNYLLTCNIQSRIIDLNWEKPDELFEIARSIENPIIGITAQPHSVLTALDIIRQLKKCNQNSIIVVGGNFFTKTHRDVLTRFKEVDIVVRDEGEITFYELVNAIQNKESLNNIEGITYRINDNIIENAARKPEKDIEKFALKYDKLDITNRFKEGILMRNYEKENYRSFPVFMGRGCPRKCAFCEYNQSKYRVRKIPAIIREIDYLIENYNAEYFTFTDPSFCERINFVRELCEILVERYPHIKWSCEARADTPLDILELMAKAGCISLDFGLESGSEKVLKAINKDIDLFKTNEFVKACYSLGIRSHMFLLVSLPGETEEDTMQTMKICEDLSEYVTSMSLSVTQILPGTELERIAFKKGILPKDFSYYDERFYHTHTQFSDPHIPIYLELLSIDFIERFFIKIMDLRAQKYDSLSELTRKAKTGLLTLHRRPVRKNLIYIRRFITAIIRKIQTVVNKTAGLHDKEGLSKAGIH